jgi:hypothetical protein
MNLQNPDKAEPKEDINKIEGNRFLIFINQVCMKDHQS